MSYKTLLYQKQGRIARITLNRPRRLNAISIDIDRSDIWTLNFHVPSGGAAARADAQVDKPRATSSVRVMSGSGKSRSRYDTCGESLPPRATPPPRREVKSDDVG